MKRHTSQYIAAPVLSLILLACGMPEETVPSGGDADLTVSVMDGKGDAVSLPCSVTFAPTIAMQPSDSWSFGDIHTMSARARQNDAGRTVCDRIEGAGYKLVVDQPTKIEVLGLGDRPHGLQVVLFKQRDDSTAYRPFTALGETLHAMEEFEVDRIKDADPDRLSGATLGTVLPPGTYVAAVLFERFDATNRTATTRLAYRFPPPPSPSDLCDDVNDLSQYKSWTCFTEGCKIGKAETRCSELYQQGRCYWDNTTEAGICRGMTE